MTCPRSHAKLVAQLGLDPYLVLFILVHYQQGPALSPLGGLGFVDLNPDSQWWRAAGWGQAMAWHEVDGTGPP